MSPQVEAPAGTAKAAIAAARAAYPHDVSREGEARMKQVPYASGYVAGHAAATAEGEPVTEREIDAAARAINPRAWEVYDQAGDAELAEKLAIVHRSREQARAALEAARAVR